MPESAADDAELGPLPQEEAECLALGHAGSPQQPDLPRPLGERHGQRVGDQERADRERHEPEQEGDPGEALLRSTQLPLRIGDRLDDERLAHLPSQRVVDVGEVALGHDQVDVHDRCRRVEGVIERGPVEDEHVALLEGAHPQVPEEARNPQVRRAVPRAGELQAVPQPEAVAGRPRRR